MLVCHLKSGLLAHLLNIGRHAIILPLRTTTGMLWAIVNGLLVPLDYQNGDFEAELGTISITRRACQREIVSVSTVAPVPLLLPTAIMSADIQLIWRRKVFYCLLTRLYIVGYVRQESRTFCRVHLLRRLYVFSHFCGPQFPYVKQSGIGPLRLFR